MPQQYLEINNIFMNKFSFNSYIHIFSLLNVILAYIDIIVAVSEIDQYLWMVGGSAGALALTGVAAASAFYLSTRPKPEKPLVTLHEQSLLETVSFNNLLLGMFVVNNLSSCLINCTEITEK